MCLWLYVRHIHSFPDYNWCRVCFYPWLINISRDCLCPLHRVKKKKPPTAIYNNLKTCWPFVSLNTQRDGFTPFYSHFMRLLMDNGHCPIVIIIVCLRIAHKWALGWNGISLYLNRLAWSVEVNRSNVYKLTLNYVCSIDASIFVVFGFSTHTMEMFANFTCHLHPLRLRDNRF